MSGIDHIFLYVILYGLFFVYDKYIQSGNTRTNIIKIYCIVAFVFVEGLRYGRGRDFFHYGDYYLNCIKNQDSHPTFQLFQEFVYFIDFTRDILPYGAIFIAISIIFIICFFKFGEIYHKSTVGFNIMGVLATQYIFEWTIRQGLSFALLLVSFFYICNSSKFKFLFFLLLGLSIHFGNIVFVLGIIGSYFMLNKRPIPLVISLPALLIGTFVADAVQFMPFIQNLVSSLDIEFLGDNYAHYVEESEKWFSSGSMMDNLRRGTLTTIITTVFYASTILIGYYNHRIFPKWTFVYNAFVVFLLLYVPFYLNEIIARILFPTTVLWFIPVSLALYNIPFKQAPYVLKYSYLALGAYLFAYYGRFVFLNPIGTYVWTALPIMDYLNK